MVGRTAVLRALLKAGEMVEMKVSEKVALKVALKAAKSAEKMGMMLVKLLESR